MKCTHTKCSYKNSGNGIEKRCVKCHRIEWVPAKECPKCGWGIKNGKCVRGCWVLDLILGKEKS